jgi:hypothetical protein
LPSLLKGPSFSRETLSNWKNILAVVGALEFVEEIIVLVRERTHRGSRPYLTECHRAISDATRWVRKEAFKKIQTRCLLERLGISLWRD